MFYAHIAVILAGWYIKKRRENNEEVFEEALERAIRNHEAREVLDDLKNRGVLPEFEASVIDDEGEERVVYANLPEPAPAPESDPLVIDADISRPRSRRKKK